MNTPKGKFIVLYGINNLGKSTQAKKLVERLNANGIKAEFLKYPNYDLEPSGKIINNYLRGGNIYNLSAREAQMFYAMNRTQYQEEIKNKLDNGITIVAEDYTGTGVAWGIAGGVDEMFLKYINCHLLKEDLAFLFDGERFREATESGHKHETNDDLTNRCRAVHQRLGEEFGWKKINANLSIDEIHNQLWSKVIDIIKNPIEMEGFEISSQPSVASSQLLRIKLLSPTAKMPVRAHEFDAGLDLFADDNYSLYPGDIAKIKTGIAMAIPQNHAGLIWDKSGRAAEGLKTMGGVIDATYRGEIIVVAKNLSDDIIHIEHGQKIAQIIIQEIKLPEIEITDNLDNTVRQDNGFGSTGSF